MASLSTSRRLKMIARQYKRALVNAHGDNYQVEMIDGCFYFRFSIKDGLYGGQTHLLRIDTNKTPHMGEPLYPFGAPLVTLLSDIYHPNVSRTGIVCVDFLTDVGKWVASTSLGAMVSAITLLFITPNPKSPYNVEAANEYSRAQMKAHSTPNFGSMPFADQDRVTELAFATYRSRAEQCSKNNEAQILDIAEKLSLVEMCRDASELTKEYFAVRAALC